MNQQNKTTLLIILIMISICFILVLASLKTNHDERFQTISGLLPEQQSDQAQAAESLSPSVQEKFNQTQEQLIDKKIDVSPDLSPQINTSENSRIKDQSYNDFSSQTTKPEPVSPSPQSEELKDRFAGIVTDPDGNWMQGVSVELSLESSENKSTVTDESGRFEFYIPVNSIINYVNASKEGYADEFHLNPSPLEQNYQITLQPHVSFSIYVNHSATGDAIERAQVQILSKSTDQNYPVYSVMKRYQLEPKDKGIILIDDFPLGEYIATAQALNNQISREKLTGQAEFSLNQTQTTFLTIDLPLSEGAIVEGQVSWNQSGLPVAYATVTLQSEGGAIYVDPLSTESNSSGYFRFSEVPFSRYRVEAVSKDSAKTLAGIINVGTQPVEPLDIKLDQGGMLRITAQRKDPTNREPVTVVLEMNGTNMEEEVEVAADGVTPTTLRLAQGVWNAVAISGEEGELHQQKEVQITADEEKELTFVWADNTTVEGSINVNQKPWNGIPPLAIINEASPVNGLSIPVQLISMGQFQIQAPLGNYRIIAFHENFVTANITDEQINITPEEENLQHVELEFVTAEIVVVDEDGNSPTEQLKEGVMEFGFEAVYPSGRAVEGWVHSVQGSSMRVAGFIPGDYTMGLKLDGRQIGESSKTPLGVGKENLIVIQLEKKQRATYELTVKLEPGTYAYKFFSPPSDWQVDPSNPWQVIDAGNANSLVQIPGGVVNNNGDRMPWPKVNDTTGEVTFRAELEVTTDRVFVRGSFNQWALEETYLMNQID